jgi:hypothetical protein
MVYDAHIDFPVPSVMIKEIGEALYICSFPKKGFVIVILYARRSRIDAAGALHQIIPRGIEKGRNHWGFGDRARNGSEGAREAFYVIEQYGVLS